MEYSWRIGSIKHLFIQTRMKHVLYFFISSYMCAKTHSDGNASAETRLKSAVMSSEDTLPHFHLEPAMWAGCLRNAAMKRKKKKKLISNSLMRNNIRPGLVLKTHLRRLNKYAAGPSRLCRDTARMEHDRT